MRIYMRYNRLWFDLHYNYILSRSFVSFTISNMKLIDQIRSENRSISKRDYWRELNWCSWSLPYSTYPSRRNLLHLRDFWHGKERIFWKRSLEQNQSPIETHTCLAPLATYILQAEPEETKPWIVPLIHQIRNDDLHDSLCSKMNTIVWILKYHLSEAAGYINDTYQAFTCIYIHFRL